MTKVANSGFFLISLSLLLFSCAQPGTQNNSGQAGSTLQQSPDFSFSTGGENERKIVLINLGDSLTNGFQSGSIDQTTQAAGFTQVIFQQLSHEYEVIWSNPYLDNNLNRIDPQKLPYNLGVGGATIGSLLYQKTNTVNPLLTELLAPIPQAAGHDVTQLEAAQYLASLNPGYKKIITLFIGNNDVLGAITGNFGTSITNNAINDFLNNPAGFHDLAFIQNSLDTIVRKLSEIPRSEIFLETIPNVTDIGYIFHKSEIEKLAQFPNANITTMPDGAGISFFGFFFDLNNLLQQPPLIFPSLIVKALEPSSNNAILNTVIGQVMNGGSLTDGITLSPGEAKLLEDRVNAINDYLKYLSQKYDNVTIVDVNKFFKRAVEGKIRVDKTIIGNSFGGGLFSLDGVHLSNTGYALLANEILKKIGEKFDAPPVKIDPVFDADRYIDHDKDGFVPGPVDPATLNTGSKIYLYLEDPNDNNREIIASLFNM